MAFKTAKNYMDPPHMTPTFSLKNIAECNTTRLHKRWKTRESSLIQGLYGLNYGSAGGELEVEAPYVQGLLSLFVDTFPVVAYREISLESHGTKKVVGGCIDLATGAKENGDKPYIHIQGQKMGLFLGCLGEAKAANVALVRAQSTKKRPLMSPSTI